LSCTNSNELKECLNSKNRNIINELHRGIDNRIRENFGSDNPYLDFTSKFCSEEIDKNFFKVKKGSELDAIIIEALRTKSWKAGIGKENYSGGIGKFPKIELPDNLKLKLPPEEKVKKNSSSSGKEIYLKSDSEVVQCMKDNAPNKTLREYYEKYENLKAKNPTLRLCSFQDMDAFDFNSTYSQYFITLDIIMESIFQENDYEKHLKE